MDPIKRILVVSRMTHECRHAVRYGLSLARQYGAQLTVMHLVSNPVDMEAVNAPGLFLNEEYKTHRSITEEAREEIDAIIRKVTKGGMPVDLVVRNGDPLTEITAVVKEHRIDLLVFFTHEEGRLEHIFFGGDNDAVIRAMPCSILLVKKEPEPVSW